MTFITIYLLWVSIVFLNYFMFYLQFTHKNYNGDFVSLLMDIVKDFNAKHLLDKLILFNSFYFIFSTVFDKNWHWKYSEN